jgi:hypothetical protein
MTDTTPIKSPQPASGKGKHARKRGWKYIIVAMGLVAAAGYLALCFLVVYAGGAAGCCGGHGRSSSDIGPVEFLLSGGMVITILIDYERERAADAPWRREFRKHRTAIHQALAQDDLPAMKLALRACLDFFDRYEKAKPETEGILHLYGTWTDGEEDVSSSMCRVHPLEVGERHDFILSSALKNNASRILDDYLTQSEQKALAKANEKTDNPYVWRPDLPGELRCAGALVDPHDIPGLFSKSGVFQAGESSNWLNSPVPAVLATLHVLSRHRNTPGRAGESTLQKIFISAFEDERLDVASVIFKEVNGQFNYCEGRLEELGTEWEGSDLNILQTLTLANKFSDDPSKEMAAEKMAFSLFSAWPKARWDFLADFYLDTGKFAIDQERDCLNYVSGPYREVAQRIAATRPGTHWESIPHTKRADQTVCPPGH